MGGLASETIYYICLLSMCVDSQNNLPIFLGTRTPAVMPQNGDQFQNNAVFSNEPQVYNPAAVDQFGSQSPVASAMVAASPVTGNDRFGQPNNAAINNGPQVYNPAVNTDPFGLQAALTRERFAPRPMTGTDQFGSRAAVTSVGFAPQPLTGTDPFGAQAAVTNVGFEPPPMLDRDLFGRPRQEPQTQRWAPAEPKWFFPSSRREWMSSCQRLGCRGRGVYCVFWGAMCPSGVRRVPCQCERGCEVDTMFIRLGQSRIVDRCNNVCSCNTVGGLASCTARRC